MRETVIKYSGVLRWLIIIGCLTIFLGLCYFLGIFKIDFEYSLIGVPINSFYGITYLALFAFGFYLILIGLMLLLPTLDFHRRKALNKYQRLIFSMFIIGLGLIVYSFAIYFNVLSALELTHTWFDYFILGLLLSFSGFYTFIFSFENIQELSQYKWIWYALFGSGILIEMISLFTYWSLMRIIKFPSNSWGFFYFIGITFLFMGGFPFLLLVKYNNEYTQRRSLMFGGISLILIISGLLTYLAPTLAVNDIVFPLSIFKYNRYFDYLYFGSVLLIVGLAIASNLEGMHKYLKKSSTVWILVLISGFCQYAISILMEITDTHFTDLGLDFLFLQSARGSLLFDMPWNVFLMNGFITTVTVLMILSSLIFKETYLLDITRDSVNEKLKETN